MSLLNEFLNGYSGYAVYLWNEITHPSFHNYFYWLIFISLFFFLLEWKMPWRTGQAKFRKDFWLDFFYMFFNFFLFSLIIYNAASNVIVKLLNDGIKLVFSLDLQAMNPMKDWPLWAILLTGFVVRDFVQWWTHRLLHRVEFLWNFHKVHHSVQEMGFAAHLRYHWMENVVYRAIEYIPLALLGIGLYDFFIIHIFTLTVGHYNHSNISINGKWTGLIITLFIALLIVNNSIGFTYMIDKSMITKLVFLLTAMALGYFIIGRFMKYIFNSPEMHIWHHAVDLPSGFQYGINFGLTLALWDYIFGTAAIPYNGRDIKLGFPSVEEFPKGFWEQVRVKF
jgi:sterol desaturase/sphingolipid hydroxylase (fatty acid hydroxylase superfamily)